VDAAIDQPWLISGLVQMLYHPHSVVRIRAADALEKIQHLKPQAIAPFQTELLKVAEDTTEQELRWHLAQILPRIPASATKRRKLAQILKLYLLDDAIIVRVCAMQGLADLARQDSSFQPDALKLVNSRLRSGTPAERARARKLLPLLKPQGE
jgi:hypothetical protein